MNVGFTGTRNGMTGQQAATVGRILARLYDSDEDEFHFGVCVGADEQAAEQASWVGYWIYGHPASDVSEELIGQMPGTERDVLGPPRPALERNRVVVDRTGFLIVAPKENRPADLVAVAFTTPVKGVWLRSGTWTTARYAFRRTDHPITVVWPDGEPQEVRG